MDGLKRSNDLITRATNIAKQYHSCIPTGALSLIGLRSNTSVTPMPSRGCDEVPWVTPTAIGATRGRSEPIASFPPPGSSRRQDGSHASQGYDWLAITLYLQSTMGNYRARTAVN